jgi:hypothetical protein
MILADFLTDLAFRHDMMLKNLLMALGGGLVGAVATGILCAVAFKAVRVKKIPPRLTMTLSLMGGFVAGWLVWAWVSGMGGYGPGPGGGVVGGTATSKGGLPTAPVTVPVATQRETTDTLRIAIVRSKDYQEDGKVYLVEGRQPARNLAETLEAIKERQKKQPDLKTIEVVIYQDSIAAEPRGLVTELEEPVRPLGLTVKTHKPGTPSP